MKIYNGTGDPVTFKFIDGLNTCAGVKVLAKEVRYRSRNGFSGTDSFTIETYGSMG